MNVFPFNSDEAIVGLMGKHIIDGERPIFFYGQSYMGSLDAYLVALSFLIFGEKVFAIRLVQLILFFLTIVNIYFYVIIAFRNQKAAFYSSIFLIFAPVNFILYTTVSLGGYGEALLIGSSVMLFSTMYLRTCEEKPLRNKNGFKYLLFIGFLSGMGLWINPISLTICVPSLLLLLLNENDKSIKKGNTFQKFFVLLFGGIFGSFFWWYQILINNQLSFITELSGSAVSVEQGNFVQILIQHFVTFVLFAPTVIFGMRPPWDTFIIGKNFVPFVIFFWILVFAFILSYRKNFSAITKRAFLSLLGIPLLVFIGFLLTSFGADPSGRYFLPIYISLTILAGFSLCNFKKPLLLIILASIVVFYHVFGIISLANKEPFITTQFFKPAQVNQMYMDELINFLDQNNENYGFSNYWVSYPLIFLTDEKIISLPLLPYHQDLKYTSRDNRIPSYYDNFINQDKYFYISTNNPKLDALLIEKFSINGIKYKYETIGDFHVFYDLSSPVSPEKLGLYDKYQK